MPLLIFLAKAFLVLIHFFVGYPNSSNICPDLPDRSLLEQEND